jgi:hypothetical protein
MSVRVLTVSLLSCALCAALVPAARAAGTNPFITKVRPLDVAIGETPTITGRGFLPGNALDGSDTGSDHDGDDLSLGEEYLAWARYGGHKLPLTYSDGTQESGGPAPVTPGVYPTSRIRAGPRPSHPPGS